MIAILTLIGRFGVGLALGIFTCVFSGCFLALIVWPIMCNLAEGKTLKLTLKKIDRVCDRLWYVLSAMTATLLCNWLSPNIHAIGTVAAFLPVLAVFLTQEPQVWAGLKRIWLDAWSALVRKATTGTESCGPVETDRLKYKPDCKPAAASLAERINDLQRQVKELQRLSYMTDAERERRSALSKDVQIASKQLKSECDKLWHSRETRDDIAGHVEALAKHHISAAANFTLEQEMRTRNAEIKSARQAVSDLVTQVQSASNDLRAELAQPQSAGLSPQEVLAAAELAIKEAQSTLGAR